MVRIWVGKLFDFNHCRHHCQHYWKVLSLCALLPLASLAQARGAIATPDGLLPDPMNPTARMNPEAQAHPEVQANPAAEKDDSAPSTKDLDLGLPSGSSIGELTPPKPSGRPAGEPAPTEAGVGFYAYNYLYAPNSGKASYFFSNTAFFDGETIGPVFQAKTGFEGVVIEQPATTWTVDAPEAYIGTSPELSQTVQVKLGRELHTWNHLDEEFQMGIWEPRFRWDYVHPQSDGLAGMHVDVTTEKFQFTAFGSPLFVPDRGIPVDFQNGGIYSINPYFVSPATTLNYQGVPTPVSYSLDQPNLTSILFHPGASVMARVGEQQGAWASTGAAFMPMNQLLYSYSGQMNLANGQQQIDATLYPRVAYHQLDSLETGYEGGWFGTWFSALYDRPIDDEAILGEDTQGVSPATSVGPSIEFRTGDLKYAPTKFRISAMKSWGGNEPDSGPDTTGVGSVFENRYFSQTAGVFYAETPLNIIGIPDASVSYRLLADIQHDGTIQSTDVYYAFQKHIIINLGADILSSGEEAAAQDPISEYRADSRVRTGVSYVF